MYGDRLRTIREDIGYSQKEVAERIDENELQIWRYENDKTDKPNALTIAKLAKLFDVSTDYLLGLTDDPTPASFVTKQLSTKERAVVSALRRNEPLEAIRLITEN